MDITGHDWYRYKIVYKISKNEYTILEVMACPHECVDCLLLGRQVRLMPFRIVEKDFSTSRTEEWHCCHNDHTILKLRGDNGDKVG